MAAKNDTRKEALLQVRVQYGELTPENVVKAAEPIGSPLHDWFEWDDDEAARLYRLEQARRLIRVIKQTYRDENEKEIPVRAFHSMPNDDDKKFAYQPLDEIIQNPVATSVLLRQATREWKTLHNKYKHLEGFIEAVRQDVITEEILAP